MAKAHVFEINDGGEVYWYAAETHDQARREHVDYLRGVGLSDDEIEPFDTPVVQADNRVLIIDGVRKTCGEWAAETIGCPVPMVGTTAV